MKNKLFEVFVCMLLIGTFFVVSLDTVSAEDLMEGDYIYHIFDGGALITKYTGTEVTVTIPCTLGGYPTTQIREGTFRNNNILRSVIVPDSVTFIGDGAFSGSSLVSITIGSGISFIESFDCAYLTSITFLGNVPQYFFHSPSWGLPEDVKVHAYPNSNFPPPGDEWIGLTMGEYIGEGNWAPTAMIKWTRVIVNDNHTFTFNASLSNDPDGYITKYEWNWDVDGGIYDESSTSPIITHSWSWPQDMKYYGVYIGYTVTLRVTDNSGATDTQIQQIFINGSISDNDNTSSEDGDTSGNGDTDDKGTPGFEFVIVIVAIVVTMFLFRKKRIV